MKKSTLWILSGVAIAVLVAGGARLLSQRKAASTPAPAATTTPVMELASTDVFTVQTQALALGLPVSGALKATQSAFIKARVAGELVALNVREGDTVQAGQLVARVDPTEYQARQRQAQQQADAAKAQVDIAQRQYDNNKALMDQGFISQTALITSQASLNGAKASYMAAVAALDVAHKALDDASLKAPFAGQVAQRLAQAGERVAVDARIVEIVNLSQLELEAALPASDATQVRVGMKAQLQVEGVSAPWRRAFCASTPVPRPAAAACWCTWAWPVAKACAKACLPKARWAPRLCKPSPCRSAVCAPTSPSLMCRWSKAALCAM